MSKRQKLSGMLRRWKKHSDGTWSAQSVHRVGGRQYAKTLHAATKTELTKAHDAFGAECKDGREAKAKAAKAHRASAPTLREYVSVFLRDHTRMGDDGDATRRAYRQSLAYVVRSLGDTRLPELTKPTLRTCLRDLKTMGRLRPTADGLHELGTETVRLICAAVSACLSAAVKDGLIAVNPAPAFGDLQIGDRVAPSERVHRAALSQAQASALLAAFDDEAARLWTAIMLACGLRPGEACALRWQDINFAAKTLRVQHSVKDSAVRGQGRLGDTKTATSKRTVPAGAALLGMLQAEKDRQENLLRTLHGLAANVATARPLVEPDDCVFMANIEARKAPCTLKHMQWQFSMAAKRAGLPAGTVPHGCRHSAFTAMVSGDEQRAGISIVDAAKLAGHSNANLMSTVYAHAVEANLQRGAAIADGLLAPAKAADVERISDARVTSTAAVKGQ